MAFVFAHERTTPAEVRFTDSMLDQMRRQGDDLADQVVRELVAEQALTANPWQTVRERKYGVYRSFVEAVSDTPTWVDFEKMQLGRQLARRHPVLSAMILLTAGLAESYCNTKANKVFQGQSEHDFAGQAAETLQLYNMVAFCDRPLQGDACFDNIMRVRLMHAIARLVASNRAGADDDVPINQEDSASTLLMFSYVVRRGFMQLGIPLTTQESVSLQHNWRYIGFLLGIDEELLPRNIFEENALYMAISNRRFHPDQQSRQLVEGAFQALGASAPLFLPTAAMRALCRKLVGPTLSKKLQLPYSFIWDRLADVLPGSNQAMVDLQARMPFGQDLARLTGQLASDAMLTSTESFLTVAEAA